MKEHRRNYFDSTEWEVGDSESERYGKGFVDWLRMED